MSMGDIIRNRRKVMNDTQDALAQDVGVSVQAVSKWETNASLPDVSLLPAIADRLGLSIDELFGREPVKVAVDQTDELERDVAQATGSDGAIHIILAKNGRILTYDQLKESTMINLTGVESAITVHASAKVEGDVNGNLSSGGAVDIGGSVHGGVHAGGNVRITGSLNGAVAAGGSVFAEGGTERTTINVGEIGEAARSIVSGVNQALSGMFRDKRRNYGPASSADYADGGDTLPNDDRLRLMLVRNGRILSHKEAANEMTVTLTDVDTDVVVHLNAQVEGDVGGDFSAGMSAEIGGDVQGDASSGTHMKVEGDVQGDATAGTRMEVGGDVQGDASAGTEMNVSGDVEGDVSAGMGVTIDGSVEGDVSAGTSVQVGGDVEGDISAGFSFKRG